MNLNDKIVIYCSADGETQLDVKIDKETVWLNVNQMAELFGRDSKTIRKHIDNAIREELMGEVVVAKFATTTQHGAMAEKSQTHDVRFYNLDVIISVGYRVKSKKGVEFRRWANKVLKDYLVKGYAVNKVLTEQRYTELKQLVAVLGRTVKAQETLTSDDALNLVEVVSDYAYALDTLDKYDYQQLTVDQTTNEAKFHATYEGAMQAIEELKAKFGGSQWFAHEKDDSFKSSIGQIYQTFGGQDLYPSVEEKAAALSRNQESFVQRWQQAHSRHAILMVYGRQRYPLQSGRYETHSRQHPCRPYTDDCRKSYGGKRRNGKGGGEFDKQK